MNWAVIVSLAGAVVLFAVQARALEPLPEEQGYARGITALLGVEEGGPPDVRPALQVVRQDYARLERRRSVLLTPLRIAGRSFDRGLGTHATSHLRPFLPPDAARFRAQVGLDDNYDTGGRRGSVVFAVEAGGRKLAESPLLHGPDAPFALDVPVGDAQVLDLWVTNGGDGDSYDQADWADAMVVMEDGRELPLDDMPIFDVSWLGDGPPFSFLLDGRPSRELLSTWQVSLQPARESESGTRHERAYLDPDTGLKVICEVTRFRDLPAVEWVLYLENTAAQDTPVIERVRALDLGLRRGGGPREAWVLHGARGGLATPEDYEPLRTELRGTDATSLGAAGGRSSNRNLPFFNLDAGERGLAVGIGWSGQWIASFEPTGPGRLQMAAGMEDTHFRLRPGERVRTPRILLVAWEGDRLRGHNLLRRTIYRHYTPLLSGAKPLPNVQCNTWFPVGDDGNLADAQNQIELLEAYAGLGIEYLVMDAGWFEGKWPLGVGNWTPRQDTFPDGLKPVGEAAKRAGIRFGMWFEPERVYQGTRLDREHPEWLLGFEGDPTKLLDLGLLEVQEWFVSMVSGYVEGVPLGYFRHDFNMDPLAYWRSADGPDRVGITELRYIEGLYHIWDEIHSRYPDLLMEGCASGGRRVDLESLSRCHTYWKSDLYGNSAANRGHVHGASLYIPGNYLNTPLFDLSEDPWDFRSLLGGSLCLGWDPREPGFDRGRATARVREFKALRHLAVGEFYPVVPYGIGRGDWTGYQFHRDDLEEGMVLLFRREDSAFVTVDVQLRGLSRGKTYELSFQDTGETWTRTGEELERPVRLSVEKPRTSVMILYRARG